VVEQLTGPGAGPAPRLTVATALGLEARAVRAGLGRTVSPPNDFALPDHSSPASTTVVAVGMRARRASRVLPRDATALISSGVAGGVAPHVRTGDVVIATEVRGEDGSVVHCPSAPLLAAAARSLGLRVHLGPMATTSKLAVGARRRALAAEGVLAVDQESSWLGGLAQDVPFAVARVIVDDASSALISPGTIPRGRAALRQLTVLAPALEAWALAVRPLRRVLLATPRSFCAGVERAIEIVEEALVRYGAPVYVRRQIVHNVVVVADLERKGAVFVEELSEVPDGVPVVLSAHGVAPAVREEAAGRGLTVVDATCPLVAKVHTEARRALRDGNTVVFIGHPNHDESEGLLGEDPNQTADQAATRAGTQTISQPGAQPGNQPGATTPEPPRIHLVETPEQARALKVADAGHLSYLTQTTLAEDEAAGVIEALRETFPLINEPPSSDICYATTNRQRAIREIAGQVELVLVVGSANSSNSLRLVEVARRSGARAQLIDGPEEIDPRWLAGVGSVGLTAGASAPPLLVDAVVTALAGLGRVEREEPPGIEEAYKFTLPPMPDLVASAPH
jgi:4-hydroxy-3-methylbut-2-en-1-yl diphosphate reductase